ncbi:MAG: O-antigen ligase family protein [Cyanobacteria bacterium REEB67]|nr:O-antigen ligase family protein [Cyanobacteria bacterium REEB67]
MKTDRLRQLEILLCLALAVALHTSVTFSWVIILAGIALSIAESCRRTGNNAGLEPLKLLGAAPLTVPLLIFIAATLVSLSVSALSGPPGSLHDFRDFFPNVRAFIIYFYVYQAFNACSRPGEASSCERTALASFIAFGALAGLWGSVQQVCNYHPFTYQYLQGTGFCSAPMPFAGLMQLTSFLALGLMVKGANRFLPAPFSNKIFFALLTLTNFLGLVFACERSAWLGLIAGLIVLVALIVMRGRLSAKTLLASSLGVIIALTLAWIFVPAFKARMAPLAHWQQDVSVTTRIKIWGRAIDAFKERPLTGVGPSHFPRITDIPEALVPGHSSDLNHAHSNYFQILSTLGVIGFLAFAFLLFSGLRAAYINSLDHYWSGGVGLGTLAALVSLMVAGLFEYNFGTAQVKLAQWFLLAALKNASDLKAHGASKSSTESIASTDSATAP